MRMRDYDNDARHHFYLARCEDCKWFETCDKAPIKADRRAIHHARRNPSHVAIVINVSSLKVVAKHSFEPIPKVVDAPPF